MIKVEGTLTLRVPYTATINMSEKDFDALSERRQDELIEEAINWQESIRSATTTEIEVDHVESM